MVMGYDLPPDLSRELAAADKIISDLEKEVERLRSELDAGCDVIEMGALLLEQRQEIERLQAENDMIRNTTSVTELDARLQLAECQRLLRAATEHLEPVEMGLYTCWKIQVTDEWLDDAKAARGSEA